MASYPTELSAEMKEREKFKEQFQAECAKQPISFSSLDSILSCYLNRITVVAQRWKMTRQVLLIMISAKLVFCASGSRISQTLERD